MFRLPQAPERGCTAGPLARLLEPLATPWPPNSGSLEPPVV